MKKIITLFKQYFTKTKNTNNNLILGRWHYDYDTAIQERKVYLANMDNCGCCEKSKKNNIINQNNDDEYLKAYFY
jgi:hypothetical protein